MNLQKKKTDCPLEGKFIQTNVIYQATVTTNTTTETLRNVTETIRHPLDIRIEEMKQNSPNMFGFYRHQETLPDKMKCFKEMQTPQQHLQKNVIFVFMKNSSFVKKSCVA